ncbi:MAG: PAS domain S-box protein, partial [Bacteriovorax sp.]|nr:PAS domain S-box protein [Bacteriovorax sp.]
FSSWTGVTASILSLLIGTFIVSLQSVKKSAIDLANRKTMDLKASEELWKFALEGAGDGVWDMDIPGNKVFTSKRFNELLGYAAVETTYKIDEIQKIVHPEDLSRLLTELLNHLSGKIPNFAIEFRLRSIDGSYIWFLDRGMIVSRDQDNLPVRMVGTIADISTQKEAEHRLESQRAKLHSIFEGTNDAIMLIDKNGHFFDCNKQTLKLFGLESKEELKSLNPADLSPLFQPDGTHSLKKANEKIQKAFESGINQFEWTHKRKNGEEFLTEVLLSAFTFESKRIIQATIRDISERKNIEESLRAEREKLMASAKMSSLGEMAGGIAHEINNPLAIIIGKISQLKRRIKTGSEEIVIAKFNEDLSLIENTAKRIGLIIKGLSAFSRNAENDSMEEVLVPVLIQDMLELSKERFKFKSVDLRFDVANCQQVFVLGRASQLLQVLINLLNNAFDAVEELPERWVEIQVKIVVNKCHIIITDSGTGIPPELVEKIMSPFFTTKSLGKGTGLGLSISKGIIEEHHGKLYYDSTSKNTRFVIELPIA